MYFQCDQDTDPDACPTTGRAECRHRSKVKTDSLLKEGPITSRKAVLRFRSFICEPMRYRRRCWSGMLPTPSPRPARKG